MAVDGLGALALGSLFDRIGIWTMALATIVSATAAHRVAAATANQYAATAISVARATTVELITR